MNISRSNNFVDLSPIIASAKKVRAIANQLLQGKNGDLGLAKDELQCLRQVFEGWGDSDLRMIALNWTDNAIVFARDRSVNNLGSTACAIETLFEVISKTPSLQKEFFEFF